jgi:hypothetical protein
MGRADLGSPRARQLGLILLVAAPALVIWAFALPATGRSLPTTL